MKLVVLQWAMLTVAVLLVALLALGLRQGRNDEALELSECREHLNEAQEGVNACEHALTSCMDGARYTRR